MNGHLRRPSTTMLLECLSREVIDLCLLICTRVPYRLGKDLLMVEV